MTKYLVTGADGQLGQCFKALAPKFPALQLHFANQKEVDITRPETLAHSFEKHAFNGLLNCAAYTAVDQAEKEEEKAYAINAQGTKNVVAFCAAHQLKLIHFSTDYVFDGYATQPYKESVLPHPQGAYARSKAAGEEAVWQTATPALIIRTSWFFSPFGKNFVNTILKLAQAQSSLSIVNDQWGRPTSGLTLAQLLLGQLNNPRLWQHNCYHFANRGRATWFEFAQAIVELQKLHTKILPIPTTEFPTPAKRPEFSVLNTERFENTLHLSIPPWRQALEECLRYK